MLENMLHSPVAPRPDTGFAGLARWMYYYNVGADVYNVLRIYDGECVFKKESDNEKEFKKGIDLGIKFVDAAYE